MAHWRQFVGRMVAPPWLVYAELLVSGDPLLWPISEFTMSLAGFSHVFTMVNAFLLGRDLRALANHEDARHIRAFLTRFEEHDIDEEDYAEKQFHDQLVGFRRGFSET